MSESPYAPPKTNVAPGLKRIFPQSSPYGPYRSVAGLATTITVLLSISIALSLGVAAAALRINALIEGGSTNESALDEMDILIRGLSAFSILTFFLTVVFWCVWKNKSCKNAWLFCSQDRLQTRERFTPGWAVGWYFVPVALWWKPYQAMCFIRDAVIGKNSTGPVVGVWWAFWILSSLSSQVTSRLHNGGTVEEYLAANRLMVYLIPIDIASAVTAILVIRFLSKAQLEAFDRIGHGE